MTNEEKQNELTTAVGETAPSLYTGATGNVSGLSTNGARAMRELGAGVDDAKATVAVRTLHQRAASHATQCLWLGVLAVGKKEALDSRGNYSDEAQRGEGFEAWAQRVLGNVIGQRTLRRYMALARAFLIDVEHFYGDVPSDENELMNSATMWCGERTLAEISREVREDQRRRELPASEDAAPEAPEEPQDEIDENVKILLTLDKILNRCSERDEELKTALETALPNLNNPQTIRYLEALHVHYGDLTAYYGEFLAKAQAVAERAANA